MDRCCRKRPARKHEWSECREVAVLAFHSIRDFSILGSGGWCKTLPYPNNLVMYYQGSQFLGKRFMVDYAIMLQASVGYRKHL